MALSSFNPLTIFNDLRDNGMPEAQAQAVVRGHEQARGDSVKRDEIELLKAQILLSQAELEKEIWRSALAIGAVVVAIGGLIIGAIAAFGS